MAKKINISGRIVGDEVASIFRMFGVNCTHPSQITDQLENANGEEIELYINSPGGSVVDASEIYTSLREYKGKKTSKIVGLAASAASWIAMAADEVLMSPTGLMMVHNSSAYAEGDHRDMENASDMLNQVDEAIRTAYITKTGMTNEEITNLMNETTWLNSNRAKEYKLIDGVMFDSEDNIKPENLLNGLMPSTDGLVNIINSFKGGEEVGQDKAKNKEVVEKVTEESSTVNETLTVEKIKNNHSELFDTIFNQGVEFERERIKNIEDLGVNGFDEIINKAKYEEPINAEKVAIEIIKSQKELGNAYFEKLENDKSDIKVDNTALEDSSKDDPIEIGKMIANLVNEGGK